MLKKKPICTIIVLWIISLRLLSSCDTRTGNNSNYTVAEQYTSHDDGKAIFQQYCASCHHPYKDATGPALNYMLITKRSDEWIYNLLKDRKKLKKDSTYYAHVKTYGTPCMQSDISKEELNILLKYIRSLDGVVSCRYINNTVIKTD